MAKEAPIIKEFNMLTHFEVKDDGNSNEETIKLVGTANFMGGCDDQGYGTYVDLASEVVQIPGVDVSIWKSNPVILWQHDRSKPIGKGTKIEKRKDSLYVECEIYRSVCSDEIFNAIKNGIVTTFSIGFKSVSTDYREVNKTVVRYIMKSKLMEISCVSIPCNSASTYTVVKSMPDGEGFYSGDLADHKSQDGAPADSQGDEMTPEEIKALAAAVVDEQEARAAVREAADLEKAAAEKALAEEVERRIAEAKAVEEAKAAEEAKALEEAEAAKAAEEAGKEETKELSEDELAEVKALSDIVEALKKALENE